MFISKQFSNQFYLLLSKLVPYVELALVSIVGEELTVARHLILISSLLIPEHYVYVDLIILVGLYKYVFQLVNLYQSANVLCNHSCMVCSRTSFSGHFGHSIFSCWSCSICLPYNYNLLVKIAFQTCCGALLKSNNVLFQFFLDEFVQ